MLNNRGQAIVIFVIILPIIILFISYVYDVANINYEKNKVNGIASIIKDNYNEEDSLCEIVYKNDNKISCYVDNINNKVTLNKKIKSIFGKIIGKEYYDIVVVIEN